MWFIFCILSYFMFKILINKIKFKKNKNKKKYIYIYILYKILINLKINKVDGRIISMPSLENREWGLKKPYLQYQL